MPSITESISDYYNTSIPSVDLNSCTVSLSGVYNELNEITYSTCSGPDKIPNTFFMRCKFGYINSLIDDIQLVSCYWNLSEQIKNIICLSGL